MTISIDIVSDVICPWCFIAKRRLEEAIRVFDGREALRVRWLPFQLNPDMPREGLDRRVYRSAKFGSWERSLSLDAQVTAAGREEGLAFDFAKVRRTPNTLDAHRLIWLAGRQGLQDAVVEALFRGYFEQGQDLSDREVLADVASGAGLDRDEVRRLLQGTGGFVEVQAEEEGARRLGLSGVPTFVVNGTPAFSGAQGPERFLAAFRAAEEAAPHPVPVGAACVIDPSSGKPSC